MTNTTNILLVDDRQENLLALEAVLSSSMYRLVSVTSGEEALRHLLQNDFAVILLDVQMPGLNGFETASLIKSREKSKHIPIIFLTAISQASEHVARGYTVGAADYIFKPFNPDILKAKVNGFVQTHMNQQALMVKTRQLQAKTEELAKVNHQLLATTARLLLAEQLAKMIGETSSDTILTLDESGTILGSNRAIQDMFGYASADIVGRPLRLLLPHLCRKQDNMRSLLHVFRTQGYMEDEAYPIDQNPIPVEIMIGHGEVDSQSFYVCTIRDISIRKAFEKERQKQFSSLEILVDERTRELVRVNEQLANERERFQRVFATTPALIGLYRPDIDSMIDMNDSWIVHTGYTLTDLQHHPFAMLNVQSEATHEPGTLDFLAGEAYRNHQIQYQARSGETKHGLLSTETMTIEGEMCVLCVITDITDRVILEKEMARLESLHLIGEMAAGIAHEIRNPMTTVRGFLQMYASEDVLANVDLMVDELDRANAIISEFLALARNKATERVHMDINSVLEAIQPLIHAEALRENKMVEMELSDCPPVHIDQKEIRQMVLNFVFNGLEAMRSGGTLTIRTYVQDHHVAVEFQDEGCGIDDRILEKIWTPFFTTKEHGTGMGLAVCYSIANRHQAVIDVTSSSNGTIFTIRFPLAAYEAVSP